MVDSFEKDAIFIFRHIEFDVISYKYIFQNQSTEEFLCIPFLYMCVSYFFFPIYLLPLIFQAVYSRVSCWRLFERSGYILNVFFRFENDIWINMRDYLKKRLQRLLIWAHLTNSCRALFYLNPTGDMSSRRAVSSATYFTFRVKEAT